MMDDMVLLVVRNKKAGSQEDEYSKYKERMLVYKQWQLKHKLISVKAGEKIDVRDTEYVWCIGLIELVITSLTHSPLLYIHFEVSL
jgi:hypothetical protein